MLNLFYKKKLGVAGFTLIELLVVIAIIGVLASIVLASLNSARAKSRDARRITDIKQLQLALELYFDGLGATQYPPASTTCSAAAQHGLEALVTGNYMPQIPRDPSAPAATNCYKYATLASGSRITYHLGAQLEDGNNQALGGDKDQSITTGWTNDFRGLSVADTTGQCAAGAADGTAGPNGTERCYDVVP